MIRALREGKSWRTGSIEESQCVRVITDHNRYSIIIEHLRKGRLINELTGGGVIRDEWNGRLTVGTYSLGNLFVV